MDSKHFCIAAPAASLAALAPAARAQISGFTTFAVNGSAVRQGTALSLTSNKGSEDSSAFASAAQNIMGGFDASFLYTVGGDKTADGFTFTLQSDPRSTSALGSGGGYLGYGGNGGMTNSAAVEFNFNQSNSTGFDTNGGGGTSTTILDNISLASGQPVQINLAYNGSTLTETLTQAGNGPFSVVYDTGNLESNFGGSSAFVGFTGSDGGGKSIQTISDFTFSASAPAVPESSGGVSFGLLLLLGMGSLAAGFHRKNAVC